MKSTFAVLLLYFTVILVGGSAAVTWDGGGDKTNWFDQSNWDNDAVPGATDDVTIASVTMVKLTNSATVASLLLTNSTLTFYGTNTILTASNIVVAGLSGKITHAAQTAKTTNGAGLWLPSNLVWIVCTNFTVATNAAVNVDGRGYAGGPKWTEGYGPGKGLGGTYGGGGGYGGAGGNRLGGGGGGVTNGSETNPIDSGSGGGGGNEGDGGAGGGAVRIEAVSVATINGIVTANGLHGAVNSGGGSGGGIYINCGTLAGGETIRANGGNSGNTQGGGGGGGRIAVRFTATNAPTMVFSASGGAGCQTGRPGTLWLSQYDGVLPELWPGGLELVTNAWSPRSFTISNSTALAVFRGNFALSVTGGVRVLAGAGIEIGTNATLNCANLDLSGSARLWLYTNAALSCTNLSLSGSTLGLSAGVTCNLLGGDLAATNSTIYVYTEAGFTNVDGVSLSGSSVLYSYCHATSGVPPLPFVVRNFLVATNSQVNANAGGYGGGAVGSVGYGAGKGLGGTYGGGGGYGGRGGNRMGGGGGGITNGSEIYPFDPGSGGGGGNTLPGGGAGGGAVRIEVTNGTVTIDGILSANGQNGSQNGGGGAGGGIYINCRNFAGAGTIRANGGSTVGTPLQGGGGGGGRIAVYYVFDNFYGTYSVTNGTGYYNSGTNAAGTGTIYRALQEGYLELQVKGRPAQHGDSTPYKYGSSGVESNSVITNSVNSPADETNGVRYACIGWTGTGSVPPPGPGTQVVFTITNNSTLTWLWTNQYHLTTTSAPNGSLLADKSEWYTNGKSVTVSAVASGGYHFVQWSGDISAGDDYTNSQLTLTMDCPKTVQANFGINGGEWKRWVGPAGGNWHTSTNWSSPGVPGDLDDVTVSNGTPILLNPARIFSLLLSNSTLTFYGTNTILAASNVTVAGASGKITHAIQTATATNESGLWRPSNLVWIVCTNFTVATNATVDVDGRGYGGGPISKAGYGPGGGPANTYGSGGSYGGRGGDSSAGTAATNGAEVYPFDPGSGGGGGNSSSGGAGGGAARIEASGEATINGIISANGVNGTENAGGGSGGGIYISCQTLAGAGTIRANAGRGVKTVYVGGSGGGGGRIAVRFSVADSPTIQFAASGGPAGWSAGRPGTLWLSEYDGVLSEAWTDGLELVTNAWAPGSFTLSSSNAVAVFRDHFVLNVTGGIQVLAGAEIELKTNAVINCATMELSGSSMLWLSNNAALNCTNLLISGATLGMAANAVSDLQGSDLNVTGATVYVSWGAGFTNAGEMSLVGTSTMYAYCHPTSGATPRPFFVRNFLVATNCLLTADGAGYAGGAVGSVGYGAGKGLGGTYGGGGGYGGRGGNRMGGGGGGITNGSEIYPFDPGSGGGGGNTAPGGGAGGGAVRIKADNTATINGIISANGSSCGNNNGGGSGGGIYIHCTTIAGNGTIRANAGSCGNAQGGGGGGGRIAIRCLYNHYFGTTSVTNGTGFQAGQVGTIYWRIQAPGTLLRVW